MVETNGQAGISTPKTINHPVYPSLFKGTATEFIDKPCTLDNGEKLWQQCYICGTCIQFAKDIGKWQNIGNGLIRHKDCDPPPYRGGFNGLSQ